jgi:DNA-binding response OmpR family regulator
LRVLCVDNDRAILEGMDALLGAWGIQVLKARNPAEALQLAARSEVHAVLADFHLGDEIDGLELVRRLQGSCSPPCAGALISADHSAELARLARSSGLPLLHKPLRPAALRALLCAFKRRPRNATAA